MRPTRTLAAALLFLLPLACSGDDDVATGGDDEDPTDETAPPVDGEPGGGDGDLFIEVEFVGGFVPFGFDFSNPPTVAVYGDGTVVVPGAVAAIYPGPALLPLFTGQLDDDVMDDLLRAAGEAGMVGATPDVGGADDLPIADAATTRVTVVVDGDERVVEAYALELGSDLGQTGLDEQEVAARAALADLVAEVNAAATPVADQPLEVERYRVLAAPPIDPANLEPGAPQPVEVAWPEGLPEPVEGECVAVPADAADLLTQALEQANELTQWRVGERVFSLRFRAVLPHEPDCPDDTGG